MLKKLALPILILFSIPAYSQAWLNSKTKSSSKEVSSLNFHEVQKQYNTYWEGKSYEKGKGYKQFKRWEWFMEPRVNEEGILDRSKYVDALSIINSPSYIPSSWKPVGPFNTPYLIEKPQAKGGSGRLNCIAFHPTDTNTFWVGAPSGGIWKTTDGGASYTTTSDFLSAIGISDIVVHPTHPDTLYVVTGDGDANDCYSIGIIKSYDGGLTWNTTSVVKELSDQTTFRRIIMNPNNPDKQIAASTKGIYYTNNGWETYSKSLDINGEQIRLSFKDIEIHPEHPDTIFAASYDPVTGNAKIFKSTNGAISFQEAVSGMDIKNKVGRIELATTNTSGFTLYAVFTNYSNDGYYALYQTEDFAESWTLQNAYNTKGVNYLGWSYKGNDVGGQGWYDLALAVNPEKENDVYIGGVNIWKSSNKGVDFKLNTYWMLDQHVDNIHADQHFITFHPITNNLYVCNDGGLYKSTNDGKSWENLSDGLSILQVYRNDVSQQNNQFIIAGSQDNGTIRKLENDWARVNSGDGMNCIIDYTNDSIVYSSVYYGTIYRSDDKGQSFVKISPEGKKGGWITPFVINPQNPKELLIGYNELYKTSNKGESWTAITSNGSNTIIKAISYCKNNANCIYYTDGIKLYKTINGGNSWTEIESMPSGFISDIVVADNNPSRVWISYSGFTGNRKVYMSDNGGENWMNYSTGIPNIPCNKLLYQSNSNKALYLGTDLGVFYRTASMTSWQRLGNTLPNVIVNDLDIQHNSNTLIAGTYGRGIWQTSLVTDTSYSYFDFDVSQKLVCKGYQLQFNYLGPEDFDSIHWVFNNNGELYESNETHPSVTFNNGGEPSVLLSIFKNGIERSEYKYKYLTIVESIDISLSSSATYACYDSITLIASGAAAFEWHTENGMSASTSSINVLPLEKTTYIVKGSEGSCLASDTITIYPISYDNVCNAVNLDYGFNGPFANFCATSETNEPMPALNGCRTQDGWCNNEGISNSVWFKFTADQTNAASIETWGFDNQIAVYEANSCKDILNGNYSILAANDDFNEDYSATINGLKNLAPGKTYWLQVDGSYGHTGEFSIFLNNEVSTEIQEETISDQLLDVYPNPTNGTFFIDIPEIKETVRLKVTSSDGRVIYTQRITKKDIGILKIDLNTTNSGIYYVHLLIDGKNLTKKIIVY